MAEKTEERLALEEKARGYEIQFHHNLSDDKLQGLIDDHEAGGNDSSSDDKPPVDTNKPDDKKKTKTNKLIKCIVSSKTEGEKEAIVGVNGKMTQIKLNEEVEVRESVLRALRNAVEVVYEPKLDDKGNLVGSTPKNVRRYSVDTNF